MFERERGGERAVLVDLRITGASDAARNPGRRSNGHALGRFSTLSDTAGGDGANETDAPVDAGDSELASLVGAAGAIPVARVFGVRRAPDPAMFAGSGKVEEIATSVRSEDADIVVFNHSLSPAQERNLERALGCRVIDRVGLILDIFAQRASTFEGKLQVELAQLRHLSTRLVRGWTHLERQKGGIGLRGPGEKQLETDRRLLGIRIRQIRKRLDGVMQRRSLNRRARSRAQVPVISLVGYTNAGKSSLFNRLTGAGVLEADQLFATLDPTLRRVELPGPVRVVMADTVGFVRDLPHDLVAAFRATLEETREADLLLHVIDASDPTALTKRQQVLDVLQEIGAADLPTVEVYNKIDAAARPLDGGEATSVAEAGRPLPHQAGMERDRHGRVERVYLSARTGEGVPALRQGLAERFGESLSRRVLTVPASAGRLRAQLIERDAVLAEQPREEGGWDLELHIRPDVLESLCREAGLDTGLAH